jgi:hypothetical protein
MSIVEWIMKEYCRFIFIALQNNVYAALK